MKTLTSLHEFRAIVSEVSSFVGNLVDSQCNFSIKGFLIHDARLSLFSGDPTRQSKYKEDIKFG